MGGWVTDFSLQKKLIFAVHFATRLSWCFFCKSQVEERPQKAQFAAQRHESNLRSNLTLEPAPAPPVSRIAEGNLGAGLVPEEDAGRGSVFLVFCLAASALAS